MGTLADFLRNLPDTDNPLGDAPGEAVDRTRGMKRDALVSFLRGAPEAAATLTTGITGQVLGGLHGLASGTRAGLSALAQDGDAGAAVDAGVARGVEDSERTTKRFTYPSDSPEAKQVLGHVGKLIEPYSEAWRRSIADPLGEVAPVLGAAAAAVPAILPGPKGAVGAVEAGVKTAGKAAKAAERVVGAGEAAAPAAEAARAAGGAAATPSAEGAALGAVRAAEEAGMRPGTEGTRGLFERAVAAARDVIREGGSFDQAQAAAHTAIGGVAPAAAPTTMDLLNAAREADAAHNANPTPASAARREAAVAALREHAPNATLPPAEPRPSGHDLLAARIARDREARGGQPLPASGHPLTQPIASSVVERAMQGVSSSQYDVLREQVMRGVTEAIAAGGSFDQALAVGRGIASRPVALNERAWLQQRAIEQQHAANARQGGSPFNNTTLDLRDTGQGTPAPGLSTHAAQLTGALRDEAVRDAEPGFIGQSAAARPDDLQTRAVMGAQAYMGQLEREGRLSAGLRRVFESRIEQMHRGELEDSHLQSYADFAPGGSRYQQAPPGAGVEAPTAFADEPPMSMSRADALRDVQERRNEPPLDDWTPEPPPTRPAGSVSLAEMRASQLGTRAVDRWNNGPNADGRADGRQVNAVYERARDVALRSLQEGASMEAAQNAAHSAVSQMAPGGGDLLGHPAAPLPPLDMNAAWQGHPEVAGVEAPTPWQEHPDLQQLRQQKGLPGISNVDPSWEHQQLIPGLEPLTPQAGARNAAMRLGLQRPSLQRELRRGDPAMNREAVEAFYEGGRDNPELFQYGVDPRRTGEVGRHGSLEDYADVYGRRANVDVDIERRGGDAAEFDPSDYEHIDVDPEPLRHGRGEMMRDEHGDIIEDKKTHDVGDYPVYDEEGNVKYIEGVTSHAGQPKKYTALGHELRRTPADRWGGGGDPKYEPRLSRGGERMYDESGDLKTDLTHDEESYFQRLDEAREEAWQNDSGGGGPETIRMTAPKGTEMDVTMDEPASVYAGASRKGGYGAMLYQILLNHAAHEGYRIGGGSLTDINALRVLANANSNYARTGINPRGLAGTMSGDLPPVRPGAYRAHEEYAKGPEIWRSESDEALKRAVRGGGKPERMAFDPDLGFTLDGKPAGQGELKAAFDSMSPNVKTSGVGLKTLQRSAVFDWVRDATPEQAAYVAKNWSKKYGPLFGVAGVGLSLQDALREKADEGVQ